MKPHVHITEGSELLGTVHLNERGHAVGDTPGAEYFIEHMRSKGHRREDGPGMLNAVVEGLDRSTYVGAHHCSHDHHQAAVKAPIPLPDEEENVEPGPAQDAEDAWPPFGEQSPSQKVRGPLWGDQGRGLLE